jgi:hypothetical protein
MSERYEIFEGWIEKFQDQIDKGQEIIVTVKDLENVGKVAVRAKIGKTADDLEQAVALRVVSDMSVRREPMFIQVLEELDDFAAVES